MVLILLFLSEEVFQTCYQHVFSRFWSAGKKAKLLINVDKTTKCRKHFKGTVKEELGVVFSIMVHGLSIVVEHFCY